MAETINKISRGHIKQKKHQLKAISKGSSSVTEYMHSIKSIADDLASMGKPLDHEDLIDRVLDGLYSSISFEELHENLINKELALQKQESSRLVSIPATAFTMHSRSHNFRSRPSRMNPDNYFRNFSR